MQDEFPSSNAIGHLQHWPLLSVFVLCVLLTIFSFFSDKKESRQKTLDLAGREAIEYQRMLEEGIRAYIHLNRDVTGFFAASGHVTAQEFDEFMEAVNALETHPGLAYIRYVPRVARNDIDVFEIKARQAFPSFTIYGSHADPDYVYPGLYGHPYDEGGKRFTGYDFSGNPQRWDAMQKARDWGKSIVTKKSTALKDPSKNVLSIFTPVYAAGKELDTIAQRRAALTGFVASTFAADEVVERIMGRDFKTLFDLEIFDGEARRENFLYDGDGHAHAFEEEHPVRPLAHQQEIKFAGRKWSLYFYPKSAYFEKSGLGDHGWLILFSGGLVTVMLSFFTWQWQRHRDAKRLQLEHGQRFQSIFENHPSAVFSLDLQRRFNTANAKAIELLESSREELIGLPVLKFITPENIAKTNELFQEVVKGNAVSYDDAIITSKGERIDVSVVVIPITIEGKITSYLGIAQNITERRKTERELQESRRMLQLVIDNIPQRVFWKDVDSVFLGCNKAVCQDAGLNNPREIVGKSDYEFAWKAQADAYRADDRETMQSGISKVNFEEMQLRRDGSQYWLRTSKIPLTNAEGETIGILGTYEDITERKLLEQKLEQMAHYDSLSGLPNRAFFYEQLQQAINRSKRHGTLLAVMYLDIDKFKRINDTYGHDIGDAVIALFAKRVKGTVREIDLVGRLGGDEFCLIVENLMCHEAASTIAEKLIEAMQPMFQIGEKLLQISTSIGIAFHEPVMAADELVNRADHAMYKAKQAGRNRFELEVF